MTQIIKPTVLPVKQLSGEGNSNGIVLNQDLIVQGNNLEEGIISGGNQTIYLTSFDLTTLSSTQGLYPDNVIGETVFVTGFTGTASVTVQMTTDISDPNINGQLKCRVTIYEDLGGGNVSYVNGLTYQVIYNNGTPDDPTYVQTAQWVSDSNKNYLIALEGTRISLDAPSTTSFRQFDISGTRE